MAEQSDEQSRAARVSRELGRCRQRGIDDLDVMAHNKEPVETPELDQLARAYHATTERAVYGRVAQIRLLLHDGLAAYAAQDRMDHARGAVDVESHLHHALDHGVDLLFGGALLHYD